MNIPQRSLQASPKFAKLYSRLFEGIPITEICGPNQTQDHDQFYDELLTLEIDRDFVAGKLANTSRDVLLGASKVFLNSWFRACIRLTVSTGYDDTKKNNALETLAICVRGVFLKSMSGWEIMEVLAGSVNESDGVLNDFTNMVAAILSDTQAPTNTRHLALQLALLYMCGAGQSSLGSYFLRRDFFSIIVCFVKSPKTERFSFEATLLLCILANFHRSDAARLNPYLRKLSACDDIDFFRKVAWTFNFALNTAVRAYVKLLDDAPQQDLASGIASWISSWRPDKALSPTPIDPPKELFKEQPIEAAVALLPILEMVMANKIFASILSQEVSSISEKNNASSQQSSPAAFLTVISLSSYILAHASSAASPRALAYAGLSLKTLLSFLEASELTNGLFNPYYDWNDLWSATLGLLNFIATKTQSIVTHTGLESLVDETLALLEYALYQSEKVLSSPGAIHEFIYQLIRFSDGLRKLKISVFDNKKNLATSLNRTSWISARSTEERLDNILKTVIFYEVKVSSMNAKSAKDAMRVVAKEVESDGLHGVKPTLDSEPPKRVEEAASFIRYCYNDILALMP
ncbi:hypothetical protein AGABI2DRAFT_113843 [Agaricus bisporus var. bisporus H97]|uniref:hypothetical protein n=1 Tax=Agaricus bisporus var. bisporus (strain H97 / ATCC MYA-4626 / FGSC 10389) TaxID=936046 RepID=UPI00029F66D7|nr:hypothetical protein AGABI2DRAFT_113843 [Agaricus bisporus var. bisporus H97]EKV51102.1 hypothetical protein AGABI2DRAFT_113843 [Agaricus bisporus var. bisporus H97]